MATLTADQTSVWTQHQGNGLITWETDASSLGLPPGVPPRDYLRLPDFTMAVRRGDWQEVTGPEGEFFGWRIIRGSTRYLIFND